MLSFLHLSKFKEQIVYLAVGVLTTAVDWVIFTIFEMFVPSVGGEFVMAISPNILAYTIAWLGAVIFSYFASRYFVFKPTEEKVSTQFGKFPFIAKLIISVFVIVLNYITSKWLVFTKKRKEKAVPQNKDDGNS